MKPTLQRTHLAPEEVPVGWFNNLSVRWKLLSVSGLLMILMAVVAVVSIQRLDQAAGRTSDMYHIHAIGMKEVYEAKADVIASGRAEKNAILATEQAEIDRHSQSARQFLTSAGENLDEFEPLITTDRARQELKLLKDDLAALATGREDVLRLAAEGRDAEAIQRAAEVREIADGVDERTDTLVQTKLDVADTQSAAAASAASDARVLLIMATLVAVVIGAAASFYLARSVKKTTSAVVASLEVLKSRDLASLNTAMRSFANGDLTVEVVPVTTKLNDLSRDEVGQAGASVNAIIDAIGETATSYREAQVNLRELIGGVQENSTSIASAADQLRDASDQMAAATGQIATAINEVTRSAVSLSGLSQDSAREVEKVAAGSQQVAAAAQENAATSATSKEATRMGERIG
ncbi:MAG: methyl-accepting chemotaxis protein, partial [Acidobacteria bacterium]|nr:methyl-accepting chemotaxis protein [Acidobacteriota bacterium]